MAGPGDVSVNGRTGVVVVVSLFEDTFVSEVRRGDRGDNDEVSSPGVSTEVDTGDVVAAGGRDLLKYRN